MNTLQVPGALDVGKFALLETFAISHNKLPVMAAAASAPGLGSPPATSAAPGLGSFLPHLHRNRVAICIGTGLTPATAAPGLGSFPPHLHRDWALPATFAKGMGSFLPHLHRNRVAICTGTGLTPATSAPGLDSFPPHLQREWAHPCHICTGTGLTPATSAPGLSAGRPRRAFLAGGAHRPRHGSEPGRRLRGQWAPPAHICAGTGRRTRSLVGVAGRRRRGLWAPPALSAAFELRYVRQLSALPEEIGALTLLKSLKLSQNVLSLLPARHETASAACSAVHKYLAG
jgi:hypothetical protein